MITTPDLVLHLARLGVGALAAFLAILLWSNTRDTAWMLIVVGTVVRYGEIIYSTFRLFGILPAVHGVLIGLPDESLIRLVIDNAPTALYAAGFIVLLARTRYR